VGRNLYILAAALGVLSLLAFVLSFTSAQTPGDVSLWRTSSVALICVAMVIALLGIFSSLYEQAERRAEEQRRRDRETRRR